MLEVERQNWSRPARTLRENHHGEVSKFGQVTAYRFKDVLDMAYTHGLRSLTTEHVDVVPINSKTTVIVTAKAVFVNDDGTEDTFTAIGDANTDNTNSGVAKHFIRMAETRAQARVLSRALNLDAVTAEELGGDDTQEAAAPRPNVSNFAPSQFRPNTKSNGGAKPISIPEPNSETAPSGYECEVCGTPIEGSDTTGTGKYTAAQNAGYAVRATGKVLCPVHRKAAEQGS